MKKTLSILLALILMTPAMLGAAEIPVGTYSELLTAIRGVRAESQARVEKAVEQEKVREAWETGKLIDAHVLHHQERADYGEKVLERLSADLGMSHTELKYMLQFVRAYPIRPPADQLSWAHYRELLSVNDAKEREALAEKTKEKGWSRDLLREEVKALKKGRGEESEEQELLPPSKPGKPGTYKMVKATVGPYAGELVLDLGFSNYARLSELVDDVTPFKEGDIVTSAKDARGNYSLKIPSPIPLPEGEGTPSLPLPGGEDKGEGALYTYEAYIYKVLDGDTIMAVVDLGFGITTTQTLRLRGIDCPELVSEEGKEAKEFVESVIASSVEAKQSQSFILIKTVKSDKYDRYLADVYFLDAEGQQVYLNNLLLEQGMAVKVNE